MFKCFVTLFFLLKNTQGELILMQIAITEPWLCTLNSFPFFHSSSIWWMPTVWLAQFYALGNVQDKVCALVSSLSTEGDGQEVPDAGKLMLKVRMKWWDSKNARRLLEEGGQAPCLRRYWNSDLNAGGSSHGRIVLTHTVIWGALFSLKGVYFHSHNIKDL